MTYHQTRAGYAPDFPQFPPEYKHFQAAASNLGAGAQIHQSRHGGAHIVHMVALVAPLVIGEIVHDSEKRWRYIRLTSVIAALVSEGMYQASHSKEKGR